MSLFTGGNDFPPFIIWAFWCLVIGLAGEVWFIATYCT